MSAELFALAVDGDLEALGGAVYLEADEDDLEATLFQWMEVASSLGHEEAAELSDALYEAALQRGGDETVATLHFEVAQWFILGEEGVVADPEKGLIQLQRAQDFHLRESVDVGDGLQKLRASLSEAHQQRFDEIFP
ncbi:MAG TPA: hypothetical protein QGF58_16145 [Myxococcota bacterium]|nr:hypothetical protein [Myxococcota bacterium]